MRSSGLYVLACVPPLIINLFAVGYNWDLVANVSFLAVFIPLFVGFGRKLDWSNINSSVFIVLTVLAGLAGLVEIDHLNLIFLFFGMFSYVFLAREALKYTQRQAANRYMLLLFFLLIALNVYFLYGHLEEMGSQSMNFLELSFYSLYYINLLILGIVGLVYYLNSYSRKSVYFVSLVMMLVLADVLRDMADFYLQVTSVLLLESLLRFGSIVLAFLFFTTREKKLRLINLV
ncbi:hypothetical protein MKO06_07480 [Gramella sp. GC03-9]|uniref:Uncharacterized protein n=1 Tax=Christiangramia oceanisediminis TaxID=2920386 RepID=A0A9X2KWD4_9FLAO|nr:hypothetical protein [Gramella oceanisediminis]MCP9199740.1 hypothetical protein [Gramella oceanisediminis]